MSRRMWNMDYGPLRGFYRDSDCGWIFGVCAGVADRFNLRTGTVRLIALISLLMFTWLTVAIYLVAAMLIRDKPLIYSGRDTEYEFWRGHHNGRWDRS